MKYHTLLLAASAAHMAFAKPIKACKARSSTVLTTALGAKPTAPAVSSVQPTPVQSSVPVTTPEPSAAPVENAAPASSQTSASSSAASTPVASTAPISGSSTTTGQSTFYGGNTSGGMCSFSTYTIPSGLYGTAFSGSAWDSAANCGACVKVTGPKGTITAMVVDQCPECDAGHLDLFQDAFAKIGDISAGIISTSYEFVECGISSAIKLHNKSGTSAYWFSMQVLNHNEPVSSLEVSTDGGSTWQKTTRAQYNFFENSSGFGTDTVDVKVTGKSGKSVTVKNVSVASDSETTASSNF